MEPVAPILTLLVKTPAFAFIVPVTAKSLPSHCTLSVLFPIFNLYAEVEAVSYPIKIPASVSPKLVFPLV